MKNKTELQLSVILGAFIFMMFGMSSVYAVSCGDVLASGKTVVLGADLTCTTEDPALTVTNGTVLNLNGHTVRGNGNGFGVILDGAGSGLKNGTIENTDAAVILTGMGGHLVRNLTVTNCNDGIASLSDGNVIEKCKAIGIVYDGFFIEGNGNWLIKNIATGSHSGFFLFGSNTSLLRNRAVENRGNGFEVNSDNNKFLRNVSDGNTNGNGFLVNGDSNWLVHNRARENKLAGIAVSKEDNRLIRNRTKNNEEVDLTDVHADCRGNIWKKNFFGTRIPATCIK